MTRFCDALARTLDWLLVAGGAVVCAVVLVNVAARYLLDFDLAWVNEFGETVFVWLTFFGGARAVRSYSHLAVVEGVEYIPPALGRLLFLVLWLLTAAMLAGLVWFGIGIAMANMAQRMSVTGWPVGLVYWAMPVGSLLAIVFVVEQILRGDDFRSLVAASYPSVED